MLRELEIGALGLAFLGWICAILTRCLPLWNVRGTVDNITASLPAYWDGVWLQWDHWDLAHDGSLHCSFYQSLMALSGSFRTWRSLITAGIGAGAFGVVISAVGAVWFPHRSQIKVFSGGIFALSGILLLVPTAWTCHHTSQSLEGAMHLRRDWGPALYLGWIAFVLLMVGGVFLTTRCPTTQNQGEHTEVATAPPQEESNHPLSRINRTTFTHSQLQRGAGPV